MVYNKEDLMKMAQKLWIALVAAVSLAFAGFDPLETGISAYVVDEFGPHYAQSDATIPVVNILTTKTTKQGETLAWGSFWVFNYELRGDTLFCVSGGNYPGVAHLKKSDKGGYVVTGMAFAVKSYTIFRFQVASGSKISIS